MNRRELLKLSGAAALTTLLPRFVQSAPSSPIAPFRFCLNTSTISGQHPGLLHAVEIASQAGYDGMELWLSEIREHVAKGNSIESLAAFIKAKGIRVENGISFTEWMVNDDEKRKLALLDLEQEMKLLAALGCKRIAAPPAGLDAHEALDIEKSAAHYRDILTLGRKYQVLPLLEFWGGSGTLFNLSQAMAVATAANDTDARILPDVYHLFRGGSGFNGLRLINGRAIDIIHLNDYPASKPVNELTDADRVYPGDGAAPLHQILRELKTMGGTKVLSLELFNKDYWSQDPLQVARTGLAKMKKLVNEVKAGK